MQEIVKRCARCKKTKPIASFHRNDASRDGWQCYCIPCWREYNKNRKEYRKNLKYPEERRCLSCDLVKCASAFSKDLRSKNGLAPHCKECLRFGRLLKLYHLSEEGFWDLFSEQDGKCAICLKPLVFGDKETSVDHCHKTGKVRGLLCFSCNTGLGRFSDDPRLLRIAYLYLVRSSQAS